MPNIHNISCNHVLNFLLKNWFTIFHRKWSHVQLKKWNLRVTVPDHWSRELNIKTALSIVKQSWLPKSEFLV